MSKRLRIIAFITSIGCFGLAAATYHIGFELWPPSAAMPDGRTTTFRSADVEACLRGRILAWFGDRYGNAHWQSCQQQLSQYGALDGLEVRFWTVTGLDLAWLVALFVFALSLRFDSPSFKVIRGARLQAGMRGLKAFARAAAAECRIHGEGVVLVPVIPLGRERETRHSYPWQRRRRQDPDHAASDH
jgi:hypothetical protein